MLWDAPRHGGHRPNVCLVGCAGRGILLRVAQLKAPPSRLSLYGTRPCAYLNKVEISGRGYLLGPLLALFGPDRPGLRRLFLGAKPTSLLSVRTSQFDPNVWSGRALQEVFVELAVSGLASMYPAFDWSICSGPSWISARVRPR